MQREEKGMAAAVVLVILMLSLGLGSAMLRTSISELLIATSYTDGIAAQYLAEAGAKLALSKLAKDPLWTGGSGALGEGHYEVHVNTATQKVVSTGTVRRSNRQIQVSYTLVLDNHAENVLYDMPEPNAVHASQTIIASSGQVDYNNYRLVVTSWSN